MSKKRRKNKGKKRGLQMVTLCISTSLVLILVGLVVFTGLTAYNLSSWVKENLIVTVVFGDNVTNHEAQVVSRKLQTRPYVAHLEYISRDQALAEQTKALGIDPSEFLGMNPFTPSVELNLRADCANADSIAWIMKDIKSYKQVEEVTYQQDLMNSVNDNVGKVSIVMLVLAALLGFVSFSLINNSVRLEIFARRFTINTMKLVGASWDFIRRPFLWSATGQGIAAAVIADGVLASLCYALYTYEPGIVAVVTPEVIAITGLSVFVFGLIISVTCVYFCVTRYLKMPTSALYKAA